MKWIKLEARRESTDKPLVYEIPEENLEKHLETYTANGWQITRVVTIADRNRAIKKALCEIYGKKNVSLVGHTGTAYGWMTIKVNVPQPQHDHDNELYIKCTICRELKKLDENRIIKLAHEITDTIGSYIGTFYSDDGQGEKMDNMHVEVRFI